MVSSTLVCFGPPSVSQQNADQVDKVLVEIPQQKPFQGNDYFDNVGWGESVYAPVTTQLLRAESNTKPEDLAQMRRIALALAEARSLCQFARGNDGGDRRLPDGVRGDQ
jgi:hypothetical protein